MYVEKIKINYRSAVFKKDKSTMRKMGYLVLTKIQRSVYNNDTLNRLNNKAVGYIFICPF